MGGRGASVYCCRAIVLQRVLEVQAGLCRNLDLRDLSRSGIQALLQVSHQRVAVVVSELIRSGLAVNRPVWLAHVPKCVGILWLTELGLAEAKSIRKQAMALTITDRGLPNTIGRLLGKGPRPKSLALILRHVRSGVFDRTAFTVQARVLWDSITSRSALVLKNGYLPIMEPAVSVRIRIPPVVESVAGERRT